MTIEPMIGQVYRIKLRGGRGRADAEFLGVIENTWRRHEGGRRATRHYRFKNLATGREVIVRSRMAILGQPGLGQVPPEARAFFDRSRERAQKLDRSEPLK